MALCRRNRWRFWKRWGNGSIPTANLFTAPGAHTRRGTTLYIHQQYWPANTPAVQWLLFFQPATVVAIGGLKTKAKSARLLKTGQNVPFTQDEFALRLTGLATQAPDDPVTVIEIECEGIPAIDHEAIRSVWTRYKSGIS